MKVGVSYRDSREKSVVLQSMSKQKLLDLISMVFQVLQNPLHLKLDPKTKNRLTVMVVCLYFDTMIREDISTAADASKSHKLALTVDIKYLRILQIYAVQRPTVQSEHVEAIC